MKIAIINGPNLNLLGQRETDIYGGQSFDDFLEELKAGFPDVTFDFFQKQYRRRIGGCPSKSFKKNRPNSLERRGFYAHFHCAGRCGGGGENSRGGNPYFQHCRTGKFPVFQLYFQECSGGNFWVWGWRDIGWPWSGGEEEIVNNE